MITIMMMMMVIIRMMIMMKMNFLSGAMTIKNERHRKQRLRKNSGLLFGIHQDIGIGVYQKMKKRDRKIMEVNIGFFFFFFCI